MNRTLTSRLQRLEQSLPRSVKALTDAENRKASEALTDDELAELAKTVEQQAQLANAGT
jgi:hypothetical protein